MLSSSAWALVVLLLSGSAAVAVAEYTPIRVGACEDAFAPFVYFANGQPVGFDVEQWKVIHSLSAQDAARTGGDMSAMLSLQREPEIELVKFDDFENRFANGTLDLFLCGLYITPQRFRSHDFLPPYFSSGLRAVVLSRPDHLDLLSVFAMMLGKPDVYALFALEMLIILSIVFAHVIWLLERNDNASIHSSYGQGIFDAFWMAWVTAITVGYGDKSPVTLVGKFVTMAWMLTGTFFTGIFLAAITTNMMNQRLGLSVASIEITQVSDLLKYRVATAFGTATEAVKRLVPGVDVHEYPTTADSYHALMDGEVDVTIDDYWMAVFLTSKPENFKGKVVMSGPIFERTDIGIAVNRPGGQQHPAYKMLALNTIESMRGIGRQQYERLVSEWFGSETMSDLAVTDDGELLERGLFPLNLVLCGVIVSFCGVWLAFVIYGNRDRIRRVRRRDFLLQAMGLNRKFSHKDVLNGATLLFRQMDKGGSKSILVSQALVQLEELQQDISLSDIAYILGKKPLGITGASKSSSFTAPITRLVTMSSVRKNIINSDENVELLTPDSLMTLHDWRKVVMECVMEDEIKDGGGLHSIARRRHVDEASEDLREQMRSMLNEVLFEVRASCGSRTLAHNARDHTPRHGNKGSNGSSFKNVLGNVPERSFSGNVPERLNESSLSQELKRLQSEGIRKATSAPDFAQGSAAMEHGYCNDTGYTSITSAPAAIVSEIASDAGTNTGSGFLHHAYLGSDNVANGSPTAVGTVVGGGIPLPDSGRRVSLFPPPVSDNRPSVGGVERHLMPGGDEEGCIRRPVASTAELGFYTQVRPAPTAYAIPSAPHSSASPAVVVPSSPALTGELPPRVPSGHTPTVLSGGSGSMLPRFAARQRAVGGLGGGHAM